MLVKLVLLLLKLLVVFISSGIAMILLLQAVQLCKDALERARPRTDQKREVPRRPGDVWEILRVRGCDFSN